MPPAARTASASVPIVPDGVAAVDQRQPCTPRSPGRAPPPRRSTTGETARLEEQYTVTERMRSTVAICWDRQCHPFTYPFCLKYSIASSVLLNTRVAVSVMNGDGMPRQAQTT